MKFFTQIPEGQAIVHGRGVYRQAPIYLRGGKVYAKHGGGFVRLHQGGGTSPPSLRWAEIFTPDGGHVEKSGYVEYAIQEDAE